MWMPAAAALLLVQLGLILAAKLGLLPEFFSVALWLTASGPA